MAQLEIRNLNFRYPDAAAFVLKDLSFKLETGEFAVLTGRTGSGKTTLLKLIKRKSLRTGKLRGIIYDGTPLDQIDTRRATEEIGYVFQNPENQIVTDNVASELAFGLENLGLPAELIRRRVAETARFFGIDRWFFRKTGELSGGEKQVLCLASVIAMRPRLLLLDEPMTRLDPAAREQFLTLLKKVNAELGITVLLVEHQLEDVLGMADRMLILSGGRIIVDGTPREAAELSGRMGNVPSCRSALFRATDGDRACPLTVRKAGNICTGSEPSSIRAGGGPLPGRKMWSRLKICGFDIVVMMRTCCGDSLFHREREIVTVLGGTGSGKTTLLKIIAGIYRPYQGKVNANARTALLPQNPENLFLGPTVGVVLDDAGRAWARELGAEALLARNFYDLSGGEKQKAGLLRILATGAGVLLLDEPTKGLDEREKEELAPILKRLRDSGAAIVIVSHDVEFAATVSDRCALLFAGEIVTAGTPRAFFSGNSFYTTASARIANGHYRGVVTVADLINLARENGRI